MTNIINAMSVGEQKFVNVSFTTSWAPFGGSRFFGTLARESSTRWCGMFYSYNGDIVLMTNNVGTFAYKKVSFMADFIVTENVSTDFHTVSAGDTYEFTKSVAKTGYTPLGIIRVIGGNASSCVIRYFEINGTTLKVGLMNNSNASKNVNVDATVLYIKS